MSEIVRQIEAALRGVPCVLCGAVAIHAGAFTPNLEFAKQINQPASYPIFYTLCDRCAYLPNFTDLFEQRILMDMGSPVTDRLQ